MRRIWNWFCQKVADYHFYKWLRTSRASSANGYRHFELYLDWVDRKKLRRA